MEKSQLFGRIERPKRLPDEIVQSIATAIADGQLKPGDRLPTESALSKRFGVARTVVREAISLMKYDGVITSRQGVGAFITDPGQRSAYRISPACFEKRKELLELLEMRAGVQSEASALAALKRQDGDLAELRGHLDAMSASLSQGEAGAEKRVAAESDFYRTIARASRNGHYVEFIGMIETRLMDNLYSVVVKNARAAEWSDAVLDEHRAVFRALEAADADAARETTRRHFELAAKRLADRADIADI